MIIDDIIDVVDEIKREKDYADHKGDSAYVSKYEEVLFGRLDELLENAAEMYDVDLND